MQTARRFDDTTGHGTELETELTEESNGNTRIRLTRRNGGTDRRTLYRTMEGSHIAKPTDTRGEVRDMDDATKRNGFTQTFSTNELKRRQARGGGRQSPVVSLSDVRVRYDGDADDVLKGVSFDVLPGESVMLIGMSGAGKSTVMRLLNRTIKASGGTVRINGQDIGSLSDDAVPALRRQIGTVFQDYKLLPRRTAYENVAFAMRCVGKGDKEIAAQVPEALSLVGLSAKMGAYPNQMSGGEQQRVSIARAMVNRPPLLICDEPTGNLDPAISLGIMKILQRINEAGVTVIMSTHDNQLVDGMGTRVIELRDGRVLRDESNGGFFAKA